METNIPGYDREENRVADLAIPLYELEQRTIKLETNFQTLSLNLSTKICNEIAKKINDDIKKYLPLVNSDLQFLKQSKIKADKWMEAFGEKFNDDVLEAEALRKQEIEFKVNTVKADMDQLTRIFSEQ